MKACVFLLGVLNREYVKGYILGSWWIFRIIRFRTLWDNSYYSWGTRIKFKWNVIEE